MRIRAALAISGRYSHEEANLIVANDCEAAAAMLRERGKTRLRQPKTSLQRRWQTHARERREKERKKASAVRLFSAFSQSVHSLNASLQSFHCVFSAKLSEERKRITNRKACHFQDSRTCFYIEEGNKHQRHISSPIQTSLESPFAIIISYRAMMMVTLTLQDLSGKEK